MTFEKVISFFFLQKFVFQDELVQCDSGKANHLLEESFVIYPILEEKLLILIEMKCL